MADWFTEHAPGTATATPAAVIAAPDIRSLVDQKADQYGVDRSLARTVAQMESNFKPSAFSPKGAVGPMQLMPNTARYLGVSDINDPEQNVDAGVRYLKELSDKYKGDQQLILAGYNAGPGAVQKYGGVPPYRETKKYVAKGMQSLTAAADTPAPQKDTISRILAGEDVELTPDVINEIVSGKLPGSSVESAPAAQPTPEPSGPVQSGDWFAQHAPPTKPATAPQDNQPGVVERFTKQYTQQTGLRDLLDIIRASNRYGTPQEVAARGEKAKTALGHVVTGLRDEPARVWNEISGIGQSMLDPKQDTADMSMHMLGAVPMFGPALQGFVHDVWAKKYPEAAADLAALATLRYGPKAIEAAGEALPAVTRTVESVPTAIGGAVKGGWQGATGPTVLPIKVKGVQVAEIPGVPASIAGAVTGGGVGALFGGGKGAITGAVGGATIPIARGAIAGMRSALADAAAARAAAVSDIPPNVTVLSPDYFDRLRLGPGPAITPPPPDTSYVRGVPGQYATPEPLPLSRQLPAGPNTLVTPLPEDTSFVRAVPAQYPEVEPGFQPPAAAPLTGPALSFDDLVRSFNENPARLSDVRRAQFQSIYDRITKGLSPEDQPPTTPPTAPAAPEGPAATRQPPVAPIAPEAPQTLQPATINEWANRHPLLAGPNIKVYELANRRSAASLENFGKEFRDLTDIQREAIDSELERGLAGEQARARITQTLQPATAVGKLTDYVIGKKIAPHILDKFEEPHWRMIADGAGVAAPTADEIAQIKANVAAKAVETPVQGEQVFRDQKARIEEGMTPAEETPEEPPNYPSHYEYIRKGDSRFAAERAFNKDLRVADYLLSRNPPVTPEKFAAKTLEEQNKLILESPAKSAKGKHLPFLPKPEGAKVQVVGRWAEEGINDIVNTMRWRQANPATAPEAAAIPTPETTPAAVAASQEQVNALHAERIRHEAEMERRYGPGWRQTQRPATAPEVAASTAPALSFNQQMAEFGRQLSDIAKTRDIAGLEKAVSDMEAYRDSGGPKTDLDYKLINASIEQAHSTLRQVSRQPAAIPTEGIETPAQAKAVFEAEKAKPAPAEATPSAETPNSRPYVDQSILSPSGRVSARAEAAAKTRAAKELFGEEGLQRPTVAQPGQVEVLRRQAQELRDLAARGMKPRAYAQKAAELEAQATALEEQAAPPEAPQTLRTLMEGEKPAAYQPKIVIHGMSGYDSNLWDMVQSGEAAGFGKGMVQKTYTPELRTDTTSAATRAAYKRLLESRKRRLLPETIKAQQKEFERLLEKDKQAFVEGRPPDEPSAPAPAKRTRRARPKN